MTDRTAFSTAPLPDPHPDLYHGPCTCPDAIGLVVLALDVIPAIPDPDPLPGLARLLDHLRTEGIPCLMVTADTRVRLMRMLTATACADRLPMRICLEDAAAPPPHPAALLLAAQRLALPPSHVLVIADGPAGVIAARQAGCAVIGLACVRAAGHRIATGTLPCIPRLDALLPLGPWIERHLCASADTTAMPPCALQARGR